jgi:hypothetical protein
VAFVVLLVVLVVVVLAVTAPLRRVEVAADRADEDGGSPSAEELRELEAARESKYREIRDAELDHQTGKLSDADFEAIDQTLRAEAIAILDRIDAAREQLGEHADAPGIAR